jgi:hypothetical protein
MTIRVGRKAISTIPRGPSDARSWQHMSGLTMTAFGQTSSKGGS